MSDLKIRTGTLIIGLLALKRRSFLRSVNSPTHRRSRPLLAAMRNAGLRGDVANLQDRSAHAQTERVKEQREAVVWSAVRFLHPEFDLQRTNDLTVQTLLLVETSGVTMTTVGHALISLSFGLISGTLIFKLRALSYFWNNHVLPK